MRLIVARHAQTVANANDITQGHSESDLTELGKKQAEKLAKRLMKEKIQAVYSSDLRRCKQTLEPFLKLSKLPVTYTSELREISRGDFEGKTNSEYSNWVKEKGGFSLNLKVPKGECFADVLKRTKIFLEKIMKKEKGKTVLVMAHGGSKRALLMNVLKLEGLDAYNKFFQKTTNTAITIVEIDDKGNHKIHLMYSADHLEDLK